MVMGGVLWQVADQLVVRSPDREDIDLSVEDTHRIQAVNTGYRIRTSSGTRTSCRGQVTGFKETSKIQLRQSSHDGSSVAFSPK